MIPETQEHLEGPSRGWDWGRRDMKLHEGSHGLSSWVGLGEGASGRAELPGEGGVTRLVMVCQEITSALESSSLVFLFINICRTCSEWAKDGGRANTRCWPVHFPTWDFPPGRELLK